jgi:hypothetical protein
MFGGTHRTRDTQPWQQQTSLPVRFIPRMWKERLSLDSSYCREATIGLPHVLFPSMSVSIMDRKAGVRPAAIL